MATAWALYDRRMRHPKIACNFLSHVTLSLGLLLLHDISIFFKSYRQFGPSSSVVNFVCVGQVVRATEFKPLMGCVVTCLE